jgi:hypothetical protein
MVQTKESTMGQRSLQFDMVAWQVVPWSAMRDDVRYLEQYALVTARRWATRETLEAFAVEAMSALKDGATLNATPSSTSAVTRH